MIRRPVLRALAALTVVGGAVLAALPSQVAALPAQVAALPARVAAAPAPLAAAWLPTTPPAWPVVVDASSGRTETIAGGISHTASQWDTVGGRQSIQTLDVDLADPAVRTRVVEAGNVLTNPAGETVGSMATRTGAVAGVNGDYFYIGGSGRPLGGVMIDGVLRRSPVPGFTAQLGVLGNGRFVMGPQTWTGSVTSGGGTVALTSLNRPEDLAGTAITEITPFLGRLPSIPRATRVVGRVGPHGTIRVTRVTLRATASPKLKPGQVGLLGTRAGAAWLAHTVHVGDTITLRGSLGNAGRGLRQLLSGASTLVRDGRVYTDPTGRPPFGTNPETLVSVSRDGGRADVVAIDGRRGESAATGVTSAQAAGYALAAGAWDAIVFDGGGSTTMVGRHPGSSRVSVLNNPSDGRQRRVANALLFSIRHPAAGAATVRATAAASAAPHAATRLVPAETFAAVPAPTGTATTAATVGAGSVAVGVWVRGAVAPDQPDASSLVVDAQRVPLYATPTTRSGWRLYAAQLPAGAALPATVTSIDLRPSGAPGPAPTPGGIVGLHRPGGARTAYVAPATPSWLENVEDPSDFRPGGATMGVGGYANIAAGGPGQAGLNVLAAIGARLATLPAGARPQSIQVLGDLTRTGATADLEAGRQALTALGLRARDLVGTQEIIQPPGADPLGYVHTFGATHYSYSTGAARVIVTDSSHGGLLASDATQHPLSEQYGWLVAQLDAAAAAGVQTVVLATNLPAYSPTGDRAGQFADRWEARMYVRLAQRYRATHPGARVLMLAGHARLFAEQVLDPLGNPSPAAGIPQLTLADLGVRPAVPAIRGGAPHLGLLHVDALGVQLDVEPLLSLVSAGLPAGVSGALVTGQVIPLTGRAVTVGGLGMAPQTIAVGDPFAHLWTSSDPAVVAVDPVSGIATAGAAGVAEITLSSGGVAGTLTLTVAPAVAPAG